jgi:hypothetical protein
LFAGSESGGLVVDGALEVGEDVEGFPGFGDVAERFLAFDRALDFETCFVKSAQLDELVSDVAADERER